MHRSKILFLSNKRSTLLNLTYPFNDNSWSINFLICLPVWRKQGQEPGNATEANRCSQKLREVSCAVVGQLHLNRDTQLKVDRLLLSHHQCLACGLWNREKVNSPNTYTLIPSKANSVEKNKYNKWSLTT